MAASHFSDIRTWPCFVLLTFELRRALVRIPDRDGADVVDNLDDIDFLSDTMRVVLSNKTTKLESELIAEADSLLSDTQMQDMGLETLRKEMLATGEQITQVC